MTANGKPHDHDATPEAKAWTDHPLDELRQAFVKLIDVLATPTPSADATPGATPPRPASWLGRRLAAYPLTAVGVAFVAGYLVARLVRRR
jgi:hypothetical protein